MTGDVQRQQLRWLEAVLSTLAAGSPTWTNAAKGVAEEEDDYPFRNPQARMVYDSKLLSQFTVDQVRETLLESLGQRGYDYLLRTSAEEREELISEMLHIEGDMCAVEYFGGPLCFRELTPDGPLPRQFRYAVWWVEEKLLEEESKEVIERFLDDLRVGIDQWSRCTELDPRGTLAYLRGLLPQPGGGVTRNNTRMAEGVPWAGGPELAAPG